MTYKGLCAINAFAQEINRHEGSRTGIFFAGLFCRSASFTFSSSKCCCERWSAFLLLKCRRFRNLPLCSCLEEAASFRPSELTRVVEEDPDASSRLCFFSLSSSSLYGSNSQYFNNEDCSSNQDFVKNTGNETTTDLE